jgi:predicted DNA-binding protein (MmcQ/YjbR family)
VPGYPVVVVKADPQEAVALREQHAEITVGYHIDKGHGITAAGGPGLDESLVNEPVADSHRLVVDSEIGAASEPGRLKPKTRPGTHKLTQRRRKS